MKTPLGQMRDIDDPGRCEAIVTGQGVPMHRCRRERAAGSRWCQHHTDRAQSVVHPKGFSSI